MSELVVMEKCREALVVVITAANVGTANIFNRKNSGDKAAPCVLCDASNAREVDNVPGNFMIDLEVTIKTIAAVDSDGTDPKPASDTLTANVIAALEQTDIGDQLAAATTNFTVFGFGDGKSLDEGQSGDCWMTIWKRTVYCCGGAF